MAAFKRISQETFDDVVKENIDEFDMDPPEALAEAISQFKKQGVDLMNLDLTGGIGRQELVDAMSMLKALAESNGDALARRADVLEVLSHLRQLCDRNHILADRNTMLMKERGGVNSLHLLLDAKQSKEVVVAAADFLTDLSNTSEAIRDFFEPGGSNRAVLLLRAAGSADEGEGQQVALLGLCRAVMRSESNKTALMREGLGPALVDLLVGTPEGVQPAPAVVEKVCMCIRGLSIHDDLRSEMSSAYDNGRLFLKAPGLVAKLMALAAAYLTAPDLASAALNAAKALVTTNEAVQVLCVHGAVDLVFAIVSCEHADGGRALSLLRSAMGLMRNLAADDGKKEAFLAMGGLLSMLRVLSIEPFNMDPALMEHAMACLAQFSLRSPALSEKMVQVGAVEVIIRTMRCFPQRDTLQRQACLCMRNIAGRCPDLRPVLLDAGAEAALRAAGMLPTVVDEAYAALRDLNIDVQYVRVDTDGTVKPAYEQFGNTGKLNFRAVYDEAEDIEEKVSENARAPFALDHDHHHHDHGCDDDDCNHHH